MPSAHLLGRPVSSPCMHAGVLVGPGRERRGIPRGQRREPPDPWYGRRARMLGWSVPSRAVGQELDEAAGEVTAPRAPDLRGEHVRLPDSAPYLDSSFQNTAPPSQTPQHDEGTISLIYFGHFIPFGHFILLFLFNKSLSEAWCHTHCVCRLLFPPHYIEGMWLR